MLIIHNFLIILLFAIFEQVVQFDFVNIDDSLYAAQDILIQSRMTLAETEGTFNNQHKKERLAESLGIRFH